MVLGLQCRREILQADDVLAHQTEDRRMEPRMGKALDLVDVVFRGQFARTGPGEIAQGIDILQIFPCQAVVQQVAAFGSRKGGMGLKQDPRADVDFVKRLRHASRIGRHVPAGGIHGARPWHPLRSQRNQNVGPLQVVVLQRRLVDLGIEFRFVLAVRLHRVKVLGTFGESAVENVLAAVLRRIGIVPLLTATTEESGQEQGGQPSFCRKNAHRARSVAEG